MSFEAVVLAAGRSRRAGTFKLALDCGGQPLIVRVVSAFSSLCRRIWVVTGWERSWVEALVSGVPGVEMVHNSRWEDGMFSSVRTGVARVTSERFFVTPGDLPLVTRGVVETLAARMAPLVVPVWAGKSGHPILLGQPWKDTIIGADPASDLRSVLSGAPRLEVPMDDDGVLRDIDTCEDYEELAQRFGRME